MRRVSSIKLRPPRPSSGFLKSSYVPWTTTDPRIGDWFRPYGTLPGSRVNWEAEACPLWLSAPVMACLYWLYRNVPSADLAVYTPQADGEEDSGKQDKADLEAPVLDVFRNADGMDQHELLGLGVVSYCTMGMTFYRVVETVGDTPSRLQWVPPYDVRYGYTGGWGMRPVGNDKKLITGFEYYVKGRLVETLKPESVVYIRTMADPCNPRLGMAPLGSALRAIVGLNRAETYLAQFMLHGTGRKLFVPADPYAGMVDEPTAQGIQNQITLNLDKAGQIPVSQVPGTLLDIGSNPLDTAPAELMDRWERTACALMGVNSQTVDLSAGQSTASYANKSEADQQSWRNGVCPIWDQFGWAFTRVLGPLFGLTDDQYIAFKRDGVAALQEDQDAAIERAVKLAGVRSVFSDNEIRAEAGFPPLDDPERDVPKEEPDPMDMADDAANQRPGFGGRMALNGNGNGDGAHE